MAKYRPGTANNNVINLFEKGKEPEEKLWISVLGKAMDDALRGTNIREAELSINWVRNQSRDFRLVCHLAGRDWKYVYQSVIKRIKARQTNIDQYRQGMVKYLLRENKNNDLSPM
jgi:hypothetical protein